MEPQRASLNRAPAGENLNSDLSTQVEAQVKLCEDRTSVESWDEL